METSWTWRSNDTTDNDFMLLFLGSTVEDYVEPVRVSPSEVLEGTDVTVMGWGDTHINKILPNYYYLSLTFFRA